MKKTLLAILAIAFFSTGAYADCTVTVNWTPSVSPDAASQDVIYFDGAADQVKQSFAENTTNSYAFDIPVPIPGDYVFIRSHHSNGTDTADSAHVDVGGLAGSTSISVSTSCD